MNRERIGIAAGIILLALAVTLMLRAVNNDLCRRAMVQKSFEDSMFRCVDSGAIQGGK